VTSPDDTVESLKSEVAAMEQLLEVQERIVAEQGEKLEAQAAELKRSNGALEQFAYVISHDLQEPLRMVSAYTELLRERYEGKLDEKADTYIKFASGGAKRMQELINALLEYSRVATRAKPFTHVPLDTVLDDVLANLDLALKDTGAQVRREPLPAISADREQWLQLFQNLLSNALKFRRDGAKPNVFVRSSQAPHELRISVTDDGIGIDPRHHARIFDIFRRVHPKKYPGTGIGLSVVQKIAERHGGHVQVESELGRGATFHVVLPKKA
jgi:light-regulated signal transduction histidine kinase (bacteriophytochrome)